MVAVPPGISDKVGDLPDKLQLIVVLRGRVIELAIMIIIEVTNEAIPVLLVGSEAANSIGVKGFDLPHLVVSSIWAICMALRTPAEDLEDSGLRLGVV